MAWDTGWIYDLRFTIDDFLPGALRWDFVFVLFAFSAVKQFCKTMTTETHKTSHDADHEN
jgi:hypothetical protein